MKHTLEEIQLISLNDDREVVRARVRWFFHLAKSGRWVARVTMNPDPPTPHVSESSESNEPSQISEHRKTIWLRETGEPVISKPWLWKY